MHISEGGSSFSKLCVENIPSPFIGISTLAKHSCFPLIQEWDGGGEGRVAKSVTTMCSIYGNSAVL